MKILILTDHSGHTVNNSLYGIARSLVADTRIEEVRVASRGTKANSPFFLCTPFGKTQALQTLKVTTSFAFDPTGQQFDHPRMATQSSHPTTHQPHNPTTALDWPDLVFLRIPHPVPSNWFTYLREVFPQIPIINRPEGIALTTSKQWLLNVPELCAPMELCNSPHAVSAFAKTRPCVLKPLEGYGGKGILRADGQGVNVGEKTVSHDDWPEHALAQQPYLAVEFLPRVSEGDKRIVVVGDEVIGAVLRVPNAGNWLANVSQGGHAEHADISFAERRIIDILQPKMQALGVVMYGIDTLMGNEGHRVLSEVNTMSIGGLNDLPVVNGRTAAQRTAEALLRSLR